MCDGRKRKGFSWAAVSWALQSLSLLISSQTFAQTFYETYSIKDSRCQESLSLRPLLVYEGPNS